MRKYDERFAQDEHDVLIPAEEWTPALSVMGFLPDSGHAFWVNGFRMNRSDDPFNFDPQDAEYVLWINR